MISIILNSYNPTPQAVHMTMACLAAIRKFTDPDYELIVVDNAPTLAIRDEYGVLNLENVIVNEENQNVYYSYDQGAKAAKGDKLFFIQSDVFVHERTINKLAYYLTCYDAVFPQQIPISRADVLQIYALGDGELAHIGQRDAGLIGMTKEAYERCGGWDTRYHNLLGEAAFFARWDDHGVSWTDRTNAFITHIMAGSNLSKDPSLYNEEMAHDAELLHGKSI